MSGSTSTPPVFYGYPNLVFQASSVALAYISTFLAAEGTLTASVYSAVNNVFITVRNGIDAIAAWQMQQALGSELVLLNEIDILPITISASAQSYLQNRIAGITAAIAAIQLILPIVNPSAALTLLQSNNAAVADPEFLTFFQNFNYEAPPAGFTAQQTIAYAVQAQQAWQEIANAILTYQGQASLTQAYDEAVRTITAFTELTDLYSQNTGGYGPFAAAFDTDAMAWSQNLSLPSLQLSADSISSAPFSFTNQQCGVIRFVLGAASNTLAQLLTVLRQPAYGRANTGTLLQNDTLMDLAARELGDFEAWQSIASLNGLTAPWTGPGGSAQPGQKLLLPTVTGQTPESGLPLPSYDNNIMGTDWYLGPIDQPMLPWTGDVQLISGLNNLSISLARRLLTTITTLIYHRDYGSRIPPEVGNIQSTDEANLLIAFGRSCLLSDPRVQQVLESNVRVNQGGYGIASFYGKVQPIGASDNSLATDVNAVLAPAP